MFVWELLLLQLLLGVDPVPKRSQLPEQLPESQVVGSVGGQAGVDLMAGEGGVLGPGEDQRDQEQEWLLEVDQ